MKKILFYEPFAGISGDMNIGAMVGLGVPEKYLIDSLKELNIAGWSIKFGKEQRKGITGTRAYVDDGLRENTKHIHEHSHANEHEHANEHNHEHHHHHQHHQHKHRGFSDIKEIIEKSSFNDNVKKLSLKMFLVIAEAEALVHGTSLEKVHFHEVGAVDSIIDIVSAALAIDYLNPDYVVSTPPQLGSGFVNCAHGKIPVPAPATLEILKNIPCFRGGIDYEATTPTGAAILKVLVNEFTIENNINIEKTAYGVGTRDGDIPNLLRLSIGKETAFEKVNTSIIECNIDDMIPEFYPYIIEKLLNDGAKDAYITPLVMKKGRPGTLLTVISDFDTKEKLKKIIFKETTTAGLREYEAKQTMLDRDFSKKDTKYGEITLKTMYFEGEKVTQKIEFDEAAKLAKKSGIPLKKIYKDIEIE